MAAVSSAEVRAMGDPAPAKKPTEFALPEIGASTPSSSFNEIQRNYVQAWLRSKAPECPADTVPTVAEKFLEELQSRHPEALEQMQGDSFPAAKYESMLLRQVALQLTGSRQTELREALALRRVQAMLASADDSIAGPKTDPAAMLGKIKDQSAVSYRRVVEGRVDDDDLLVLFKQAGTSGVERKTVTAAPAKLKELTAAEIVSEFARHNQAGSALPRWRAYVVVGHLKTAAGEEQQLTLYKMRPDRFRLVVQVAGICRYVLSYDGEHYWQQMPGQAPEVVAPDKVGSRRDFREFLDPLFEPENATFERLADGVVDGRSCYRLRIHEEDRRDYVSCIDRESFHELRRETADQSQVLYSDFREVAGITLSFREESTDQKGQKGVLEITRVTANPGLIQALFEQPLRQELDFFTIDRLMAQAPATNARATGTANR